MSVITLPKNKYRDDVARKKYISTMNSSHPGNALRISHVVAPVATEIPIEQLSLGFDGAHEPISFAPTSGDDSEAPWLAPEDRWQPVDLAYRYLYPNEPEVIWTREVIDHRYLALNRLPGLPPVDKDGSPIWRRTFLPSYGWFVKQSALDRFAQHLLKEQARYLEAKRNGPAPRVQNLECDRREGRNSAVARVSRQALYLITSCAYCGNVGTFEKDHQGATWHMEHVDPLSRGGLDNPCNIVKSCASCNRFKGVSLWKPLPWTLYAAPDAAMGDLLLSARGSARKKIIDEMIPRPPQLASALVIDDCSAVVV